MTGEAHDPIPHTQFMPGYALEAMLQQEVSDLADDLSRTPAPLVTDVDLEALPAPVQRYLRASQIVGKPRTLFARWRMQGEFRLNAQQKWMPMTAEQYNRVDYPARLWYAMMKFMPLLSFYVRDAYVHDEGNMYAKLTRWHTLFDVRSPELNESALLLLFNDMAFFPSAYLSEYVRWEGMDEYSARGSLTNAGITVSAEFQFNQRCDLVNFVADRYRTDGKGSIKTRWSTPFSGHREINGVRVPTLGEVIWHLESGDFPYLRASVTDVECNLFARYP